MIYTTKLTNPLGFDASVSGSCRNSFTENHLYTLDLYLVNTLANGVSSVLFVSDV